MGDKRLRQLGRGFKRVLRFHIAPGINDLRYGRLPVAMITGSVGKTTTSRLVAAILRENGLRVGLACTDGIYLNGELVEQGDFAGYKGARKLFRRQKLDAAVLETARGGLITEGLFMRRGKVGALLNIGPEHIGVDGIDSLGAMAEHKAKAVLGSRVAVLNGDDPHSARFIDACGPGQVSLFSARRDAPDTARVLSGGGSAFYADEDGHLVLARGSNAPERIAAIADIPITLKGAATHYTANVMAAAAIADGLDVPLAVIASALRQFRGGMTENPGRWTAFEGYPFTVVAERGLNAAAFRWTLQAVRSLPVEGNRILVFCAVGNRQNLQYDELTELAAPAFDRFIAYENDAYRRGRAPGEVPALLEAGLLKSGVARESIETAPSLACALTRISGMVRAGDLVFILANEIVENEQALRQAFAMHVQAAHP